MVLEDQWFSPRVLLVFLRTNNRTSLEKSWRLNPIPFVDMCLFYKIQFINAEQDELHVLMSGSCDGDGSGDSDGSVLCGGLTLQQAFLEDGM